MCSSMTTVAGVLITVSLPVCSSPQCQLEAAASSRAVAPDAPRIISVLV
jgi:hypothetical protein